MIIHTYYLTMEFENEQQYQAYSNHPQHIRFINEMWLVFVDIFQEADYTAFSKGEL